MAPLQSGRNSGAQGKLQLFLPIMIVLEVLFMNALMHLMLKTYNSMFMGLNMTPLSMQEKGDPKT